MKDEQLIEDLINEGESEQLEFKEVVRKESIAKVLCSFLNNKGGRILVGVSDKGKVLGLPNAAKHLEQLKIYLLSAIIPESPVSISVEPAEGKAAEQSSHAQSTYVSRERGERRWDIRCAGRRSDDHRCFLGGPGCKRYLRGIHDARCVCRKAGTRKADASTESSVCG